MNDAGGSTLDRLRLVSLVEGVTLLLLVAVAAPLKHVYGYPLAVTIMGSIHGLAFLALILALRQAEAAGLLAPRQAGSILLAACIPLGALWIERRVKALRPRGAAAPESHRAS